MIRLWIKAYIYVIYHQFLPLYSRNCNNAVRVELVKDFKLVTNTHLFFKYLPICKMPDIVLMTFSEPSLIT